MEDREIIDRFKSIYYKQWASYRRTWLGTLIVKYPADLMIYQMLLYRNKPDFLIETGSYFGGSALFFASIFDLMGHGHVISIDRKERDRPKHPRITYIVGRTTAVDTLEKVHSMVDGKACTVALDSDHRYNHVKRELIHYSPMVSVGQSLVIEDTFLDSQIESWKDIPGPSAARDWFLKKTKDFVVEPLEDAHILTMNPKGYLRRVR